MKVKPANIMGVVGPLQMVDAMREGSYVRCLFDNQPLAAASAGFGDPTGTDLQIDMMVHPGFPRSLYSDYGMIGAETIVAPLFDPTLGLLDISLDQTAAEGSIENYGGNTPRNPFRRIVGDVHRGSAWYAKHSFKVEDASGVGKLCVGLFKQEANQSDPDNYDEAAFLSLEQGDIYTNTILNGGATTRVLALAAAWADGEEHDMAVYMKGGVVRFLFDDQTIGQTGFAFDAAEVLINKRQLIQGTDVSKVYPTDLEMGPFVCFDTNP